MNTLGFITTKILMEKEGLPDDIVKKYSLVSAMMPNFEPLYLLLFQKIARDEAAAQQRRLTPVTSSTNLALASQQEHELMAQER